MIRFASPTFLFRDTAPHDLPAIMEKLAEIGFDGIELYSMFGFSSGEIGRFCRDTGLVILCDHIPYDEFSQDTHRVLDSRKAIGARYLTIDKIPFEALSEPARLQETIAEIERIAELCHKSGIQLLYHNHGYDLTRKVGGVATLDLLLDGTDPELLKFQPDLGWLTLGGGDPQKYLKKHIKRCPIIHLKDYYADKLILIESAFLLGNNRGGPEYNFFEFRPSGYGIMNFPLLMPAVLACNPEWITVDHDLSYERDTFEDMEMSLKYISQLAKLYP